MNQSERNARNHRDLVTVTTKHFPHGPSNIEAIPEGYKNIPDLFLYLTYGPLKDTGLDPDSFNEIFKLLKWDNLDWFGDLDWFKEKGYEREMKGRFNRTVGVVPNDEQDLLGQVIIDSPIRPTNGSTSIRFAGISTVSGLPTVISYSPSIVVFRPDYKTTLELTYLDVVIPQYEDDNSLVPPDITRQMIEAAGLNKSEDTSYLSKRVYFENYGNRVEPYTACDPRYMPIESIPQLITPVE